MTALQRTCLWRLCVVALGVFFITAGVYLYINWIEIFTRLRGKEMALSPTSPSFPSWKVSPLPLNFDVYLFNWTNPQDFYIGSSIKPHFEQLGPYRFREHPDKVDIAWHNHNHSISFRKKATFYFDAAGSQGKLDDKVTTVHSAAYSAARNVRDASYWPKLIVRGLLSASSAGVSITKTAEELIFKGYQDPLLTAGSIAAKFKLTQTEVPYERIGWIYPRNDSASYDGHFNMHTGADDISKLGQIHTWNHMTNNGRYNRTCGDVKGSMGEFFPPNLTPNDSIAMYLPDMCRSVPLDYTETVEIHGVKAYKYSGTERAVDNGTLFPEAKCFCVNGTCEAAGVINISPCKYDTPIYMSYPHFYKADPSYLAAVDGLAPKKELHEFFMTLEPNAGVPMDVGGGFQANFLLEAVPNVPPFDKIPRTFMPIVWCEERVRVTPELAREIALVPLIVLLGQVFTGFLLASGVILIFWYPTKLISQLLHADPKTKSSLLKPLSGAKSVVANTPQDVPLLQYKDNSFMRTDSLLHVPMLPDPTDCVIR